MHTLDSTVSESCRHGSSLNLSHRLFLLLSRQRGGQSLDCPDSHLAFRSRTGTETPSGIPGVFLYYLGSPTRRLLLEVPLLSFFGPSLSVHVSTPRRCLSVIVTDDSGCRRTSLLTAPDGRTVPALLHGLCTPTYPFDV